MLGVGGPEQVKAFINTGCYGIWLLFSNAIQIIYVAI